MLTAAATAGERRRVTIPSTLDGAEQPCYVILPSGFDRAASPVPLLVSLHSWSADLEQRNRPLEELADQRGWIYLFPNFRGRNDNPDACGSAKAQQDILDAVAWAQAEYPVNDRRIYLTGVSGGGHMTMLMTARYPEIWAAASAWVGISDLAAWYRHTKVDRYREMMRQVCGGAPGESPEIDEQYRIRSPIAHLHHAGQVPFDLAAGIHDGHEGSVSIRHSLDAYNAVAKARQAELISETEIEQLSKPEGRLAKPTVLDQLSDPALGRQIHLRRQTGQVRITIFEGGHEGVSAAAVDWLARHQRPR